MNAFRLPPSKASMRRASSGLFAIGLAVGLFALATTAQALSAGARAPEIGLADLSGRRVTLEALRGKVVLVDFWASWCEPCATEMPQLQRLYQELQGDGFEIIGVSQDRSVQNAQAFVRSHRVTFPVVHDGAHAVANRYQPPRMPTSYLIDKNGIVREVHQGYQAGDVARLRTQIQRLLAAR